MSPGSRIASSPATGPTARDHAERAGAIESARETYRIDGWSGGYFNIDPARGNVVATPQGAAGPKIDLHDVVRGLRERGLHAPVLLRFTDVLVQRLRHLHEAFSRAISENEYRGQYRPVYPIKVNQQSQVVHELSEVGRSLGFGLEVGSKPELLAVMAVTSPDSKQLIICNGFKDPRYIEAVVLATKLGRQIIPVVENISELQLVIDYAERYGIKPLIGVRAKLATPGEGRWKESGGSRSKFGLFVSEMIDMVELLKKHDLADSLKLLHVHNGSQIQNIRTIKNAITEFAHIYCELKRLGAGLEMLDIGGGMAVDYTGEQANAFGSMNYSLDEFASDVVYRVGSVCNEKGVEHPTLVTESGRAMVAYSSVLVFNILGGTGPRRFREPPDVASYVSNGEKLPQPIIDLKDALENCESKRLLECYHDAQQARDAAILLFSLGHLSLPLRALAERLYWATCFRIRDVRDRVGAEIDELDQLDQVLSDVYFGNFSLFQSLPDTWAIDQLFPIMPIHRLDQEPTVRAILADITCDSDGKIDRFISGHGVSPTLPLHELTGEDYYLGVFLVGAYQETLGDLHNLFGDCHAVHIKLEGDEWVIDDVVKGDTVAEVLEYVQYEPARLTWMMNRDCEKAVRAGRLTVQEARVLMRFYESGMSGQTYLEPEGFQH